MTVLSVRRSNRIDAMTHRRSPRIAAISANTAPIANSSGMYSATATAAPSHHFTLVHTKRRPRSKPKTIKRKPSPPASNDDLIVFKSLRTRQVLIKKEEVHAGEMKHSICTGIPSGMSTRTATRASRRLRRSPRLRNTVFEGRCGVRRSPRITALGP